MVCSEHGWLGHVGIHESGHATAGVLLGFEFKELTVYPGRKSIEQMALGGGSAALGGVVLLTDDPAEWVAPRQEDAFVYLLAGSLSEREFWGHWLTDGYVGDMRIWRIGTGRTGAQDPDELRALTGPAVEQTAAFVKEHSAAILRVYKRLVEQVPHEGDQHFDFDEPLTLSYDDVRAAVLGAV